MSRRRHIVFINEFYHPDICASAIVAADHLPRIARLLSDCHITVVAGNRAWNDPSVTYPEHEEHEDIKIVRVPRPALRQRNILARAIGFASFGRNAVKAAGRFEHVDLVIGTTAPPQGGAIAQKIAHRRGCPYIYTVLDLYPDLSATLGKMSERSPIYKWWLKKDTLVMRDAAAVVAIADGIIQRIAQTRGIDADKLFTIHDGFDAAKLVVSNPNPFRSETNPNDKFLVQYAGNMGLSHPFETIMGACQKLVQDEEVLFQFIGDGPQRAYIATHLRTNVRANGQLLDYQPSERLGDMLTAADICLVSQDQEMYDKALPHKIYGILAAGRPVIFIGNMKSEIAAWLRSSGAGMQVNQGDVGSLVLAIQYLKQNRGEARRMGEAGRQLFQTAFQTQQASEKWAQLIQRVLN